MCVQMYVRAGVQGNKRERVPRLILNIKVQTKHTQINAHVADASFQTASYTCGGTQASNWTRAAMTNDDGICSNLVLACLLVYLLALLFICTHRTKSVGGMLQDQVLV